MQEQTRPRLVSRRDFNQASITALFAGMTVWMAACGGGGSSNSPAAASPTGPSPAPPPPGTTTSTSDIQGSISDNHGHAAVVTSAQLQASGAVTLHIQALADHDHTVDLTSDQIVQVAAGSRVSVTSSTGTTGGDGYGGPGTSHNHTVTFN